MTATYTDLTGIGISSREGSTLTGLHRSTATRRRVAATAPTPTVAHRPAPTPANKLSTDERLRILDVLNCDRFVDLAPLQIFSRLLDEGTYLCSVSTMYRVLHDNRQVGERRRLARHPARACPELVATAPRQVYSLGHHQTRRPRQRTVLRRLRDDRHLLPLHRRRARPQS